MRDQMRWRLARRNWQPVTTSANRKSGVFGPRRGKASAFWTPEAAGGPQLDDLFIVPGLGVLVGQILCLDPPMEEACRSRRSLSLAGAQL